MSVIDVYLDKVNPKQRAELERVRKTIKWLVPDAVETISYGMPVFKYKNKYLVGFAPFKNHMSIFPGPGPIESLGDKLSGYVISKGTVQFTLDKPLSDKLLQEIIAARIKEIDK